VPRGKPISYAAVVNARSALRLNAHLLWNRSPNSNLSIEASVDYATVPLKNPSALTADVVTPSGLRVELKLEETHPGRYFAQLPAIRPGVYETRIRARGLSQAGYRFVRELTLTPAIEFERDGSRAPRCDHWQDRLISCKKQARHWLKCFKRGWRGGRERD
jgi:hypothetical protein